MQYTIARQTNVGVLAIQLFEMSLLTKKKKSKLEITMQGTVFPDECPNLLAVSGRGHEQHAPCFCGSPAPD